MEEFCSCRKCQNGWVINEDEAEKCVCLKKYQEEVENELLVETSNLPQQIKDYSIDKYIGADELKNLPKLDKYVKEFKEKYSKVHLFIYGSNSTQKTTVMSWVAREIAKEGSSVHYCLMNEIVKDLMNEQFDEKVKIKIDKYYESNLLLIDEAFDLKKLQLYASGYQISFIDEFLRTRLERHKKSTIFISNVEIEDIDIKFGTSIIELVKRNCSRSTFVFKDKVSIVNDFDPKNDLWS